MKIQNFNSLTNILGIKFRSKSDNKIIPKVQYKTYVILNNKLLCGIGRGLDSILDIKIARLNWNLYE